MRTLTRRVAALAIVSTLTLAGCGGAGDDLTDDDAPATDTTSSATEAPDDEDDAADDTEVPDGDTIEGTGYTFAVPEGWRSGKAPSAAIDVAVGDAEDDDGFADNINVIRLDPAPLQDPDPLEDALVKELEGVGSQNITVRDRLEVDGAPAVHIASALTQQGTTYQAEQYNPIKDGVSYVITFSFSDTVSEDDRDDLAESVLASWKWAS